MKSVILKYANRKLYSKDKGSYVSLTQLANLPMGTFTVIDYETKKDITEETLLSFLGTSTIVNVDQKRVMEYLIG